ncbi:acetyl-CoA acetyltransferase [Sinorhizobium medicae]|uniref:thiolase family protein n=1 Tax=Sinorhizobium medicae TaxID=110321 RepID=UPI000C7A78C3|nr:thiolase family protein [Sinorhizobium medicae]PLU28460.1 acetyl-CoA acetyltransferase [Sinorhizobium medicae]PLU38072.1 acetyl-CoA acetyltransferase [Sinorhizobium medicae]PLU53144.1 acetyl-CoA acetyltransferase [Sinorhizobium medicae]PLU69593.1 acetyl-CoA acetyltransferase [Sinorhizobium medicae]
MNALPDPTRTPVLIAALRTPVCRVNGSLAAIEPASLAALLIENIVANTGIDRGEIDDVLVGNAANSAGNLARLAALEAGLPISIPGVTVDRQCGSGLEAIVLAARQIQAGAGRFYIAGGTESASRAHIRLRPPLTRGEELQPVKRARMAPDSIGDPDMGVAAEYVATACGISRDRQDRFALESHRRAVAAENAGRFAREIVPVSTAAGTIARDECPRANASAETLSRLKPAFVEGGTVTAGNACPVNDGAAMVLVTNLAEAQRLGARFGLVFADAATAGIDPNLLGLGPVPAMAKLRARNPALDPAGVDFIEFNEAFASQVLGSLDRLDIAPERINREGGAIALGHPYGASGAILVVRLFSQMLTTSSRTEGLAVMGIGGGMGIVAHFRSYRPDQTL